MRDLAAALQAEADAIEALAHARERRYMLEAEMREAEGLQTANSARTILGNMAHTQTETARRRGRPTKSKHPFPAALDAAGKSVAEWAREHKIEREVVKSWFAPPPAGRRIPEAMAKAIEKEFKVPATERVWTNGIR